MSADRARTAFVEVRSVVGVDDLLYKVSEPAHDNTFEPRPFWRTADWAFSDDRPHDGLIEDSVLYAAEFDEVNIHLLPRVRRLRVWLDHEERVRRLRACGFDWPGDPKALLFVARTDQRKVEEFAPTVFAFDRAGFHRTPTHEFVSREAQTAISVETIPIADALRRWRVEVIYVPDTAALEHQLRGAGIDHQIQT
jgi:hypothetical protein